MDHVRISGTEPSSVFRTWLDLPSGTPLSTSSDTHQVVEIKKETFTKMYIHHFKWDVINNMDHNIIIIWEQDK